MTTLFLVTVKQQLRFAWFNRFRKTGMKQKQVESDLLADARQVSPYI
jgi:hypothetical protein